VAERERLPGARWQLSAPGSQSIRAIMARQVLLQKGITNMRKRLPVIARLRKWRKANGGLSARQTSAVMEARGLQIPYHTLEVWDSGVRNPGRFAAKAVEKFLDEHPTVDDAPKYRRYKISPEQVEEILRLRKQDMTLSAIAQRFDISESSVSRICSGSRRAKYPP
jgi:hypothetical protein